MARVLHIITGLSTGGAERALYSLLAGGLAEMQNTSVISLTDEGTYGARIRALGVPVHALGMRRGVPGPVAIWRLHTLVQKMRPDVVQGWMYHGNLAASIAAWLSPGSPPKLAWNVRHSLYSLDKEKPLTQLVIKFNRWMSGRVGALLYNSRLSKQQHEAFGFAAQCGRVIPNGFDTEQLKPDVASGQAMRNILAIPLEATVLGHVARFHPIKDHVSFLRAAVDVMRLRSEVFCVLAGRDVNLQNPALVGIVPPELENRFRFVGERSDIPDLMQAMDVFCQSSWSEAFPNVLGEAMALGVPCVATDVGDSRDILGEAGILVPPSDCRALAEGLISMLTFTEESRKEKGRLARAHIEARYSLPGVVKQYLKVYEQLITK
jgi:glycosyltransferase involved in cell wall biosynthesis